MNTNKKVTVTINYASLLPAMVRADAETMKLADALITLWNAQDVRDEKAFRKGFIEFAVSRKYDRRWAMDVCTKAGFRARAAGGGRKKTKPTKDTAEAALAIVKALTLKERNRFIKMLAAL